MSDIFDLPETPSDVPAPLATVDELKAYLNYRPGVVPGGEDDVLQRLIDHASSVFHRVRQFYPDTGTRDPIDIDYGPKVVVVPDVRTLTEVRVDGELVSADRYRLKARRRYEPNVYMYLARQGKDPILGEELQLTGEFGFPVVPHDVHTQVLVLAARDYYERQSRHADVSQDPDGGGVSYFRQLPLSVKQIRDSYRVRGLVM